MTTPAIDSTATSIRYLHQVYGCTIGDLLQDFTEELFTDTDPDWRADLRLKLLETIEYPLINLNNFRHSSIAIADFEAMRHTAYRYNRSWSNLYY